MLALMILFLIFVIVMLAPQQPAKYEHEIDWSSQYEHEIDWSQLTKEQVQVYQVYMYMKAKELMTPKPESDLSKKLRAEYEANRDEYLKHRADQAKLLAYLDKKKKIADEIRKGREKKMCWEKKMCR